jgi:hypothetical protein
MDPASAFLSVVDLIDRPGAFCVQGCLNPFPQPLLRVEGRMLVALDAIEVAA